MAGGRKGRIGAKRCASSYAYRSLLDAGAKLAFGSDWPVAPLDPLAGIDAAVNRRTLDGKHPNGWFPEQAITVAEAIEAYTLGGAMGGFQERIAVRSRWGNWPISSSSRTTFSTRRERDHIAETKVVLTVVGGKTVFERK